MGGGGCWEKGKGNARAETSLYVCVGARNPAQPNPAQPCPALQCTIQQEPPKLTCFSCFATTAVFSKSYCPHCRATKQLLDGAGAKYYALELDQVDDGAAIQDALQDISGQRTVPNIFIAKKHIGGNSDLQARADLKDLLAAAGAV